MISILANTLVVAVHALDGSAEADRLDALGGAVAGPLNRARRQLEKADNLDQQIAVLARKADRVAAEGITRAVHQRAAADWLIDAARAVHQGTGPLSEPAVDPTTQDGVVGYRRTEATPEVDQRPHRLASYTVPIPGGPVHRSVRIGIDLARREPTSEVTTAAHPACRWSELALGS